MTAVPGSSRFDDRDQAGLLSYRREFLSAEDRVEYLDKEAYRPLGKMF